MISMNANVARPRTLSASPLDLNSYQDAVFAALKQHHAFTEQQLASPTIGQLVAHCHMNGTPIHDAARSIAEKLTVDFPSIPPAWDRSDPAVRARLAADRPATTGATMDPFAEKTTIKQPKEGSKEAGTRALRVAKATAKPAVTLDKPTASSHAMKLSDIDPKLAAAVKAAKADAKSVPDGKPAPAPKPESTPKAPATPEPKPTKESALRKPAKKTAKAAGKPATKAKPAKPGTERRKKPARTSGARKPATAPKAKGPNKGESVIALISKGWTKMSVVMKETEWLPHTARAFFSRCKKPVKDGGLGLKVEHRNEGGEAEYRIAK